MAIFVNIGNVGITKPEIFTFEDAINELIEKYSYIPISSVVIHRIEGEINSINYHFEKHLKVEVKLDGTLVFSGEEMNFSLTRKVLIEKIKQWKRKKF